MGVGGAHWQLFVGLSVLAHVVAAGLLFAGHEPNDQAAADAWRPEVLTFRLVPPQEGVEPYYIVSRHPNVKPPEGQDGRPDPGLEQGGALPMPADNTGEMSEAELADYLAEERDSLRAELEQLTEVAQAEKLPQKPLPMPMAGGDEGEGGKGPEGAIRELDLEGYPQGVVDDIMARYKLKVVTREFSQGQRGQNFLSSAATSPGDRYFGGMEVPAGVYEVFLLSRDSVALMSRLEEEALRKDGLEPLKSKVNRIVFGIVKDGKGGYELGVKSLDAEAVAP